MRKIDKKNNENEQIEIDMYLRNKILIYLSY